jgi:hypothetical protein
MRVALTAVATAVACFAVTAATGLASHSSTKTTYTVRVGDYLKIPAVDLSCLTEANDPNKQEAGPIIYCFRTSDRDPDDKPAVLVISKSHFKVAATGASGWTATIWRHP